MGKPLLPVYLGLQYKECPYYIFQGKNHGQHNRGQGINLQTDKKAPLAQWCKSAGLRSDPIALHSVES